MRGVAPDIDEDLEDEEPSAPPKLAAAAEELLALTTQTRVPHEHASDTDHLLDVLRLLGRLHALCISEAGFFVHDPTPVDDVERVWAAEQELAFARRCADELADLASSCVRFAIALWVDLRPEWEEAADARRQAVTEAREELLTELGILSKRSGPTHRLTPTKHDVAEFLRPSMLFASLACADAAHELADQRMPGTAGSTMLGLAASLLTDGDEIATAATYATWPHLGDDW